MLRKYIGSVLAAVFLAFYLFASSAGAVEIDEATRTLPLNDRGETVTLSVDQLERGKTLFNNACSVCHKGGATKTNNNVSLSLAALAGANPRRDNIEALIDYIKNPTSYDGFEEIYELHPSIRSADLFPRVRNLTDDDLYDIAGHMLVMPKIKGILWGGGKTYN